MTIAVIFQPAVCHGEADEIVFLARPMVDIATRAANVLPDELLVLDPLFSGAEFCG